MTYNDKTITYSGDLASYDYDAILRDKQRNINSLYELADYYVDADPIFRGIINGVYVPFSLSDDFRLVGANEQTKAKYLEYYDRIHLKDRMRSIFYQYFKYVTKLMGHVYDGENLSAEALINGVFAEITMDGVKKVTAAKDTKLRVDEKTELWGQPAVVLNVTGAGSDDVYFVENEWEIDENAEWNEANYTLPIGKYVRMKRLLPGEQVIMTVDSTLYAALAVGDAVQPAAGGTIAKVTTTTGGSD